MVKLYLSFGAIYLLGLGGILLIPDAVFKKYFMMFMPNLLCLVVTCFFITDITRMMVFLSPFFVMSVAFLLRRLRELHSPLFGMLAIALPLGALFSIPTVFTLGPIFRYNGIAELEDFYFGLKYPILAYHTLVLLLSTLVLFKLRRNLWSRFANLSVSKIFNQHK
jgi:hypothetical protein